ncbi:MAG TPA: hypothetical protein VNO52_16195 [Methylomirabilota bacterium]|nr:hypothetical protein [Methylomirabilota bacterium]
MNDPAPLPMTNLEGTSVWRGARGGWLAAYWAALYAVAVLVFTGLTPAWGRWYGVHPYHRVQSEALLEGRLALSASPLALKHDLAWAEGGVHQVWGLGIPLWRLPWDALARLLGTAPIPEALAYGLALAVTAWLVLRASRDWSAVEADGAVPAHLLGVFLLLAFPALLNLVRHGLSIYDAVLAYVYLYGVAEAVLLVSFIRRPTLPRWLGLPDLKWWTGPLLWMAGGGVLFVTNLLRFGDGFEFGHRLNLQAPEFVGSMYATRFDHPFDNEPVWRTARELFGALFLTSEFNPARLYLENFFPGQSPTVRIREFYMPTFDWTYVGLVLAGWGTGLALFRRRSGVPGEPGEDAAGIVQRRMLVVWSLVATGLLGVFYLRTPALASRYLLDFAPAFAGAALTLYLGLQSWFRAVPVRQVMLLGLLATWLGFQWQRVPTPIWGQTSYCGFTWAEIQRLRAIHPDPCDAGPADLTERRFDDPRYLPFDGNGWRTNDGRVAPLVSLFVRDAEFLELDLRADPAAGRPVPPESLRAKVGLEFLCLDAVEGAGEGRWRVRFHGPRRAAYRRGLQVAFLALTPNERLAEPSAPWFLERVRWRGCELPSAASQAQRVPGRHPQS